MTPANPDTFVVSENAQSSEGYVVEPVIGWHHESGTTPSPVTANGLHRVLTGSAILFSSGHVTDPNSGFTFETVEEWLDSNPSAQKVRSNADPKPQTGKSEPASSGGAYDIEWTDRELKNRSFWRYDDGQHDFVFVVEGGSSLPKATKKVTKIKRDDFSELKREIDVLEIDEIINAAPIEDAEEPEFDEDEDEDDGEDLI